MEILTDQDIPDVDTKNQRGLFYLFNKYLEWLKSFSAPNIKYIGSYAFSFCRNLTSVDFPLITTIEYYAFGVCENLTSINFPFVTAIGKGVFSYCDNLTSVDFPLITAIERNAFSNCEKLTFATFGTGFVTETKINFGIAVYGDTITKNINILI